MAKQSAARIRKTTAGTLAGVAVSLLLALSCSSGGGRQHTRTATTLPGANAPPAASAAPTAPAPSPTLEPSAGTTSAAATPAAIIYHGNPSRRAVALTFDAGADTGFTAVIINTLRSEGVRATFGLTGLWAEHNRDLLLAIAADGHQIVNHTYDHASFTGLSTEKAPLTSSERSLELSRTETTIYHLTQRSTRPYFRPPYGDLDASVARDVATEGYSTIVMWSIDTLGWKGAAADDIVARCLAQAAPGAIYVMHVGAQSQDAAALPRVIQSLRADGYEFETVDEILR